MAIVQDLSPAMQAGAGSAGVIAGGTALGMGLNRFGPRRTQRMVPEIAGATSGVGIPVVLRETVDEEMGPLIGEEGTTLGRVGRPSAAWGIFGGLTSGAVWWVDGPLGMDVVPDTLSDFLMWYAVTGVPTGIASAALPKNSGGGAEAASEPGTSSAGRSLRDVSSNSGSGGTSGSSGRASSDFPS